MANDLTGSQLATDGVEQTQNHCDVVGALQRGDGLEDVGVSNLAPQGAGAADDIGHSASHADFKDVFTTITIDRLTGTLVHEARLKNNEKIYAINKGPCKKIDIEEKRF